MPEPTAPVFRYKSFEDFLLEREGLRRSALACMRCDGYGRIIDPEAHCDPQEGYKMARRIKCPTCQGEKVVKLATLKAYYERLEKRHEDDKNSFERDLSLYRSAVNKLSDDEINVLRKYKI